MKRLYKNLILTLSLCLVAIILKADCDLITISGGEAITISGLDEAPISQVQIFDNTWATVYSCAGNCESTELVTLPEGTYYVYARLYTASWQPICETNNTIELGDVTEEITCDSISIVENNNAIEISGLDIASNSHVQIFNSSWITVFSCASDCNATELISLPADTYYVYVKYYTNNWEPICETNQTIEINNSNPCDGQGGDNDNDGVCDNIDCDNTNPNLPTTPGTTCDDNNPDTSDDIILEDGCTCEGTPI